ncbi:MAG: 4Fe-4S dicluster domain-containing protein [Clostridia bacterium]|nr:4Fe-4S dicluster domain-containing protein [Clostridia bacterium]
MMGFAVSGAEYSATKTTGCLLLMTENEAETHTPGPCINCGRCANACPMRLMPMFMDASAQAGDLDTAVKYGLTACIECGCCSYVCPAKRTLVQSFKLAKKKLRGRK